MKTMTNEECADRVPESERNNVEPFHLCAGGQFGADEATGLEDDSCQVTYSIYDSLFILLVCIINLRCYVYSKGDSGGPLRTGNVVIGVVSNKLTINEILQ